MWHTYVPDARLIEIKKSKEKKVYLYKRNWFLSSYCSSIVENKQWNNVHCWSFRNMFFFMYYLFFLFYSIVRPHVVIYLLCLFVKLGRSVLILNVLHFYFIWSSLPCCCLLLAVIPIDGKHFLPSRELGSHTRVYNWIVANRGFREERWQHR